MRREGGDPDAVLRGPGLPAARFVELHIEQGPILHHAGEPFALVSGVRGALRYRDAGIDGVWAHSGGEPRAERADAVFAFADLVTALDGDWAAALAAGRDLAVTFGRVDAVSAGQAVAKVPGRLDFCLDLRSDDEATLERFDAVLRERIAAIEARRGITFRLGAVSRSKPATLSASLNARIALGAARIGVEPRRMLSGGGHDAAAFAAAGWDSTMVFLRNRHGSHNPDEAMDETDLARAVAALAAAFGDPVARA